MASSATDGSMRIGPPQAWHNGALPLRELRAAAGAVQAGLLAFFHAGVAGQEVLLAELGVEVAVVPHQGAGDALHAGAGLAGAAAAVDANDHVDAVAHAAVLERRDDRVAILLDRKIVFQLALVDRELAAAGANSHAGDRGFAATGSEGVDDFFVRLGIDCVMRLRCQLDSVDVLRQCIACGQVDYVTSRPVPAAPGCWAWCGCSAPA